MTPKHLQSYYSHPRNSRQLGHATSGAKGNMATYFGCIVGRVSGKSQIEKYGPGTQIEESEVGAKEFPLGKLEILSEHNIFIQERATGWSRKKWEAAMDAVLALYRRGILNVAILPRIDRETRFLAGSFQKLMDMYTAGLIIYFARERLIFDPENTRDFGFYVNEALKAQGYIDTLKENTIPARYNAAKRGEIPGAFGRYGAAFGLRYDKQGKRFLHIPGLIEIAHEVLQRYWKGESRNRITLDLQKRGVRSTEGNIIQRSTVYRILSHASVYAGMIEWGGIEIRGKVDGIIKETQAKEILARLQWNKQKSHGYGRRKWATGRVFCGVCGRRYSLDANKGCRCNANLLCSTTRCDSPKMTWRVLNQKVWAAISEVVAHPVEMAGMLTTAQEDEKGQAQLWAESKAALENQLLELAKRRRLLSIQHEHSGLTDAEYLNRLKAIKDETTAVEANLCRIDQFQPSDKYSKTWDILSTPEGMSLFFHLCSQLEYVLKAILPALDEKLKDALADFLDIKVLVHPDKTHLFKLEVMIKLPIPSVVAGGWPQFSFTDGVVVNPQAKPQMVTVSASSGCYVFLMPLSPKLSWHAPGP